MAFGRAVAVASILIVLLASTAESVKECLECLSSEESCQSVNKTTCTRENAAALLQELGPLFPNAAVHSPPSDKFSCLRVVASLAEAGSNDYRVQAELRGCIFETDGEFCADHIPIPSTVNARLECKECTSDNCNGAMAVGGSMLVMVASCLLMRIFS